MGLSVKHLRDLFGGKIPTAQVLQGVATGMADCGVTVVIDPNTAHPYAVMEEKKIVLPSSVKSARALLIVSWHIDHEAGHLIYTPSLIPMVTGWRNDSKMKDICDPRGYGGLPDKILETAKFFHNLLEDARVEQLMVGRFPGSKKHFIGGPIAAGVASLVEDTIEMAKDIAEEKGKKEIPLSPFWVCELHGFHLLGGSHGQRDRDHVRNLVPDHVKWACDIADEVFGQILDVREMSSEDLADLTDTAMAMILDKVLPDLNAPQEDDEDGEGESDDKGDDDGGQQQDNGRGFSPFDDEITPSDKPEKSKYDYLDDDEEDDDEEDESSDDDSGDSDESDDDDFDPFEEEGDDSSDEDRESGEGTGDSEGSDDDSDGGSEDDDGDDVEHDDGDDSLDDDDSDDDGEASGSEGDGDESGESSGGRTGASDDDDSEGAGTPGQDEDGSSNGQSTQHGQNSDDEDDVGSSKGEGQEGASSDANEKRNAALDQVMDWADDAKVDMSELMREGGEDASKDEDAKDYESTGGGSGGGGNASPNIKHAADIDGMPDEYLETMAPGCGTHVIQGLDLDALIGDGDSIFTRYDTFIRQLMPGSLGPAARKLVGKFRGATGQAWSGNRVNPRMLQPIAAGKAHGRPLYLRRNETVNARQGVVVQLCIDCSGSMNGDIPGLMFQGDNQTWQTKFAVAHAAARSIARLLQTIKVPFSVMGFTTKDMPGKCWSSTDRSRSRSYDIVNFLFKDFAEPWTNSEDQMIAMNQHTSITYKGHNISPHTNSDGESLLWAASRLMVREEDRKIMIVLSDGLPFAGDSIMQSKFLKWAVRRIELAGIHIGGLGLGDEGVKHYYKIHELLSRFPAGHGTELTAPLYIQEKLLTLIDRLSEIEA